MFTSLFGKKRDRFTLAELRRLNDILVRHHSVTAANRDTLVETFREIAELMIWGDQHEPGFFDLFVEQKTLAHFSRFMTAHKSKSSNRGAGLTLQLLQTLSIMIQNTREETSLFYLFSNNYINDLIEADYDFEDEEVMAYYISFLKSISLKLNEKTVQFFFSDGAVVRGGAKNVKQKTVRGSNESNGSNGSNGEEEGEDNAKAKSSRGGGERERGGDARVGGVASFPLYTSAIRFLGHSESMVRAAVRTIVLSIFSVTDPVVRRHLLDPTGPGGWRSYVPQVVTHITNQVEELDAVTLTGLNGPGGAGAGHAPHANGRGGGGGGRSDSGGGSRRSNVTAELGDLLYYVNDILCLQDLDLDLDRDRDGRRPGGDGGDGDEVRTPFAVDTDVDADVDTDVGAEHEGRLGLTARAERELWRGLVEPKLLRSLVLGSGGLGSDERVSALTSLFVLSRLVASCSHRGTLTAVATALLHPAPSCHSTATGGVNNPENRRGRDEDTAAADETVADDTVNPYRESLLAALRGVDVTAAAGVRGRREDLAAAAATLLATLLRARNRFDEATLEAGGALPARRRRTKVSGEPGSREGGG